MLKLTIGILIGGALAAGTMHLIAPTYKHVGRGYVYAHVPYPDCPANFKIAVDAPERDEVDALTVTCAPEPEPIIVPDKEVAAGSWKIDVQVPPCDKLKMIAPDRSGYPARIVCEDMPVVTR